MTTITNNSDALASLGLAAPQNKRSGDMGQADFLRLMTEQLKNQDPLKPLEGSQFLGQLAQFSTVQGIENMQKSLGAVASVMESDQTLRAAALVGHDALVDASTVSLQAGAGVRGEIVAQGAGPVQVDIVDAGGQVVQRMTVNSPGAGNVPFAWDGNTANGSAAPAGRYTVRAAAGSGADAEALDVRVAARVDSVSIEATGLVLNLNGLGSHPLSAVRRIG
ncbi:flagellar hook assembly protein FlgD [Lysobacter korlensis]|uniref:Basal-body rod modification protein FlgD n=1 Tax=Lysobacter korlensis TaxID=553636 RepID=A0ABV6RMG4_9GAMM